MERTLPYCEVTVEDDGETVHLRLSRQEANALAELIRKAAQDHFSRRGRDRLRGIAKRIITATRPKPIRKGSNPNYKVDRPPNWYPSEIDRHHVLSGSDPYPVLCQRDLGKVYPLLEKKGLSAPEIAERLHLDERTIYRWRKKLPTWMKEIDDQTDPAG